MKSTGIVRKVDELGRVVIPKELRRTLEIKERDPLEIYVENDKIILKKYQASMTSYLSGEVSDANVSLANGKLIVTKEEADKLAEEIQSRLNK